MASYDDSISTTIKKNIIKEMEDTSKDIHITTKDGYVTLTGVANVLYEKLKCEQIAKKIYGVKTIENDIAITTDGTVTDRELTEKLNENLRTSPDSDKFLGVTGKVNGGSALLIGEIENEKYKKEALMVACKTYGIKDIVNNIDVSGTSEDINLSNTIYQKLTENRINISDITYTIKRNNVTLNGFATNEREIAYIVDLIESIETVKHVNNKLKPRPWKTGIRD
ncbi:BON domain-containing protein [Clostridium neuense]|uniref:BON domain-containing protein n=1 Tax=Clostridium neuense TaxID=1728934 RepID=A0ABW8TC72_9CLOT